MIEISYIEKNHSCSIKSKDQDNWGEFTLFYSELSEDFVITDNEIQIPWHSFIANFETLRHLTNKFNIEVEITEPTLSLIRQAVENKVSINNLESAVGIPSDEVQFSLNKLGFQRDLTPEQERNISILSRLKFGATFSVPGAGKTTEAIAFYLLKRNLDELLLVICPKSAFPAWEEQFYECLKENCPIITRLVGGYSSIASLLEGKSDVYLITYQQYIRVVGLISKFLHHYKAFVFLDESHRIKGGNSTETGRQMQNIAHLPVGKLIMSGTPMPNRALDLVSQYNFLFPEQSNIDELTITSKIQDIYVRTTKEELGLKKPKVIHTPIAFTEPQKVLYDLSRSEELRKLVGLNRVDKNFYRGLQRSYMRLLQIVSNPALLMRNSVTFPDALKEAIEYGDSGKISYTIYRARQLTKENKKVLIWSGFVENVELVASKLLDIGANYIHGGVESGSEDDDDKREGIIKKFHDDPNCMVLVANPAAASEGISLHKICHHAIYIDRNYNAAQFLQSMDRIHRLGLLPDTETTIEVLITPDSIDDRIESRLSMKIDHMAEVLNDRSLKIEPEEVDIEETGFSTQDAEDLFNHLKDK
jgi:SNF2 family DNA or RNA helicase